MQITTLPAAGTLTLNGVAGHRRPVHRGRRHRRRQPGLHAGRQRQRHRLRQLHLPGAGQRRHGQRRRRPRPERQHAHHQRHRGQRRAGRHRQHGHDRSKTRPTPSRPPTSASPIRSTARPTRFAGRDRSRRCPAAGTLTLNGVGGRRPASRSRGRHRRRQPGLHPGRQRQRHRLRQLHLPGAGRRRHGQRRRRSRPDAPTRITINVTAVNDAPAGTEQHRHDARGHGLHLRRRRLRLHRSDRHAGQRAAGGQDHDPAGGRHADAQRRRGHGRPDRSPSADITAGNLVFTPAANANGAAYASFTFQVQDDGGTANGGVDLDPTRQHDHHQRHRGQRRAGRHRQRRSPPTRTRPTPSRPPTSASPIRTTARPTRLLAVRITTLPAAGTLTLNGVGGHGRPGRSRRPTSAGNLVFTPAANANGTRLRQLHLPGAGRRRHRQRRRRPRPDAPTRSPSTSPRSTTRRPAPTTPSRRSKTTAYTFAAADFGFTDPNDSPANALAGGQDHHAARRRHADASTASAVDGRPGHRVADIIAGNLDVHAGGQRQRHRLRQLHLPGAGRRRHGQRRRRPRSDANTITDQRHLRSTMRPRSTWSGDVTVNEDAPQQTVSLTGIGTGAANESQTVTITATSDNTGLVPHPSIVYTSPQRHRHA